MVYFDRRSGRSSRTQQQSRVKIFPSPRRGLIRNDSYVVPSGEGAEVLDNFFPTPQGIRLRGGQARHATVGAPILHYGVYNSGANDRIFAATGTDIYDVTTPADPDVIPTPSVTGQTSGDYSSVQFTAAGGIFLIMVNGADEMQQFDGTSWSAINDASAPVNITGVETENLSAVWKFKSRLFFIEQGTLSAWYLPVNFVGGAALELPLGGIFQFGGTLSFGITWSLDSGAGLDDVCVFVTSEGEMAVFQGTDPSNANTWQLVGVYLIGRPLGKNAWFRAGGDVGIATDEGVVPISSAVKQDRAAVLANAISYPIEDLWRRTVSERRGSGVFNLELWHSETMLVVGVPGGAGDDPLCLIANARTGAWARYTGWDAQALAVFNDQLFIGGLNGRVYRANVTGADDQNVYSGVVIPRFDTFEAAEEKQAVSARVNALQQTPVSYQVFCNFDWQIDIPPPLPADPDEVTAVWGVARWGQFVWGGGGSTAERVSQWRSVRSVGYSLSPGVQISSGRLTRPDVELISLDLLYMVGRVTG